MFGFVHVKYSNCLVVSISTVKCSTCNWFCPYQMLYLFRCVHVKFNVLLVLFCPYKLLNGSPQYQQSNAILFVFVYVKCNALLVWFCPMSISIVKWSTLLVLSISIFKCSTYLVLSMSIVKCSAYLVLSMSNLLHFLFGFVHINYQII